jgi:activating signal cointegrator 1
MKTLSLLQPWASLVVMGQKKIETRSWSTSHRGELLIHASLGKKGGLIAQEDPFKKYIPDFNALPFGAIIGKVILEDVLRVEDLLMSDGEINKLSLEERAFGDYGRGRWAWILEDAEEFSKPIYIKGSLGLWEYAGV